MASDPRAIEIVARVAPDGSDQHDLFFEGSGRTDRPSRVGPRSTDAMSARRGTSVGRNARDSPWRRSPTT
jgi:hypothetical protein